MKHLLITCALALSAVTAALANPGAFSGSAVFHTQSEHNITGTARGPVVGMGTTFNASTPSYPIRRLGPLPSFNRFTRVPPAMANCALGLLPGIADSAISFGGCARLRFLGFGVQTAF